MDTNNGKAEPLTDYPASHISDRIDLKLHPSNAQDWNTVTGYGEGYLEVNGRRFAHPLLLLPEAEVVAFGCDRFEALGAEHFEAIAELAPQVVLLGTGERQKFVRPELARALTERRIGIECMDTRAACRTYNILMAEGRKVAAALLLK
jgi:uncharacterized protein